VRFLNDVCLRQMMTASPNDVRCANDAWLRHIWRQTSHHCDRREQHHIINDKQTEIKKIQKAACRNQERAYRLLCHFACLFYRYDFKFSNVWCQGNHRLLGFRRLLCYVISRFILIGYQA
jgi:hypothetical protein